jgi:hypothetical protein
VLEASACGFQPSFGVAQDRYVCAVDQARWLMLLLLLLLLLLLAGGCAAPGIVNGPVHEVLGRMQMEGKAPLGHIDQVHAALDSQLARLMATAAGPMMAPQLHPEL